MQVGSVLLAAASLAAATAGPDGRGAAVVHGARPLDSHRILGRNDVAGFHRGWYDSYWDGGSYWQDHGADDAGGDAGDRHHGYAGPHHD